jgi:hypothetical protein
MANARLSLDGRQAPMDHTTTSASTPHLGATTQPRATLFCALTHQKTRHQSHEVVVHNQTRPSRFLLPPSHDMTTMNTSFDTHSFADTHSLVCLLLFHNRLTPLRRGRNAPQHHRTHLGHLNNSYSSILLYMNYFLYLPCDRGWHPLLRMGRMQTTYNQGRFFN